MLILGDLTRVILAAAIAVHRMMGPGLLEAVYEECFCRELERRGIPFKRQVQIPVAYRGKSAGIGYRSDVIVADAVVVEIKSIEAFQRIHEAKLINYMRLSGLRVGLLINFNVPRLLPKGVIRRVP